MVLFFGKVGKSLAISILDLSSLNPNSRLENSDFKSLSGLRELLRLNIISECNRNRRLGSKSANNSVETPITSKQVNVLLYYVKCYSYLYALRKASIPSFFF